MKRMLVTNIKFKAANNCNDNRFTCNVPVIYSGHACIAQHFLRAQAFNETEVTFDFEDISDSYMTYSTQPNTTYEYLVDMYDAKDEPADKCEVLIMHTGSCVVCLEYNDNNDTQLIYEALLTQLYMTFMYDICQ